MKKFLLVLFVIFFVNNSISKPTNFDYDTYRNIADHGVYVNVSPSEIDGDGDSNNSDFFDSAEIVKREIHFNNNKSSLMPIQKFSESVEHFNLSDIIYRIEKAFLTTASNLIQTFTNTLNTNETIIIDLSKFKKNSTDSNDDDDNNNNNNSSDENRSFISFVHKIQKREISENIATTETINSSSSEEVSNSDESQKLAKIAIYPNVGYFPLIPTFDFRLLKRNAKKEIKLSSSDNGNDVVITDANSISTTTVTEKTTTSEKLLLNNTTSTSSSSSSSSSSTTTSTTTKNPIKELKENEKDVKEKIAEIEAEPVILSSRI